MKKLIKLSLIIPLVDVLFVVLVLYANLIPVLNNILVIYTFAISPIIEAIIIGIMSDKVKNKIYKIFPYNLNYNNVASTYACGTITYKRNTCKVSIWK